MSIESLKRDGDTWIAEDLRIRVTRTEGHPPWEIAPIDAGPGEAIWAVYALSLADARRLVAHMRGRSTQRGLAR